MWPKYIHHITIHFPIVLLLCLGALGVWSKFHDTKPLRRAMQVGGWFGFAMTTVAIISGLIAAPGFLGSDGTAQLAHHRELALTTWALTLVAAGSYQRGMSIDHRDWRMFGVAVWIIAAFAVIGAGHWGGASHNPKIVPWYDQAPIEPPNTPK